MKYMELRCRNSERYKDREKWGAGPWDDEPDKVQWLDHETRLPCLIIRNPMGGLCGYVGVGTGHPWFGVHYDSVSPHPDVHGGLTYSDSCSGPGEEPRICHIVEPGEDDNVWWLGFDCIHAGDAAPGLTLFRDDKYRDLAYVKQEVESLARQARDAA